MSEESGKTDEDNLLSVKTVLLPARSHVVQAAVGLHYAGCAREVDLQNCKLTTAAFWAKQPTVLT